RPTIAVPYPQQPNGALDLDGFFGLHPLLEDLMPFWEQKQLAFVHACGLPTIERSHFQAQDYIENGTPGIKKTRDGWMNRLLAQIPKEERLTQALNVGVTTPYIFKGKMDVANLRPGKNSITPIPTDRPQVRAAFSQLYGGTDELSQAFQAGTKARDIVLEELNQEMMMASRGAKNVDAFMDDAAEVAKLMVGNSRTQLAFMDIGGWDSHANQNQLLSRQLPPLGKGLATLMTGLEPILDETVVVVMSEFGRTVKENGNKGTDHGFGNVMWLLGGAVKGGEVYGDWLGLSESALYKKRDLPVNTDFRDVLSQVLVNHLGIASDRLNPIFPDFQLANSFDVIA
ncbi:MAG: DUF1501 domain-containing protein, partial [Cyanobacteria bacterium J06600_6]